MRQGIKTKNTGGIAGNETQKILRPGNYENQANCTQEIIGWGLTCPGGTGIKHKEGR